MILNILLIYLALGIFLNLIDPVKKVINEEVIKISFENLSRTAHGSNPISESKIFIFKIILILGTILFWPFLLPGICKKYKNSTKSSIYEYPENTSEDEKEVGINFRWMNGHGTISCSDCEFSQEFTVFTHGYSENESGLRFPCSTSGFQCQSCGKFTTRKRIEPFVKSVWEVTFEELPDEERADRIEHMISMKKMCESYMNENPKEQWLGTWEPTVTEYTEVLNTVPPEEIKAVKEKREEFKRQYAASLFCDCGGRLDKEKILFCPSCKSNNLKYDIKYMT